MLAVVMTPIVGAMTERKLPVDVNSGLVTLSCNHVRIFRPAPPRPGDEVYCGDCQQYRTVKLVANQISVRCGSCKYSRHMGVGGDEPAFTLTDALAAAGRHVMRNVHHWVVVTDSDGTVHRVSNDDQGELPMAGVAALRNTGMRTHQNMLRTAFNRSERAVEPRSDMG